MILIGFFLTKSVFACEFTSSVELEGIYNEYELLLDSEPNDKYSIKCFNTIKVSGIVDKLHILKMDNGAEFSVLRISRKKVISKLKKMYVMLNTPNAVLFRPQNSK